MYFRLFKIPIDIKHPFAIVKKLPPAFAVAIVPVCSFVSFFVTTKTILSIFVLTMPTAQLF